MTKRTAFGVLAVLLAGVAAPAAQAQDERAGTDASAYLRIPLTARAAALGVSMTSGVTGVTGVEALQANPAALTLNTGTNALFSRVEYFADADIGVNFFGLAQRVGNNQIALSISAWDFGDIQRTTVTSPELSGETWDAPHVTIGLSYARQFTDRIAAGLTVKGISETIDDVSATAVAFDAGMTYQVGESGLRFGVSLKNFGPQMQFGGSGLNASIPLGNEGGGIPGAVDASRAELPSMLNFGAAYTRQFAGDVSVTGLANFRSNAYDQDQYAVGLEAGYANLVYVRGGYQMMADMDFTAFQGWSVGGGLNLDLGGNRLGFDYAYQGVDFLGSTNYFTVAVTI